MYGCTISRIHALIKSTGDLTVATKSYCLLVRKSNQELIINSILALKRLIEQIEVTGLLLLLLFGLGLGLLLFVLLAHGVVFD